VSASKPVKDKSLDQQCVCPSWLGNSLGIPFRRFFHNPDNILKPYIKPGWTVLDVGPGMGYFTIPLAKLAGENGTVFAADLQPQMLAGVRRQALRDGVTERVVLNQCKPDEIGVKEPVDFCLAFWMVHEVPNRERFIREITDTLKPGGLFLFVEPKFHVSNKSFEATLEIAKAAGLSLVEQPKIFISYAALMKK
jgi:ubiquinone/menaquinone biosynthesis C-methylase UbiE